MKMSAQESLQAVQEKIVSDRGIDPIRTEGVLLVTASHVAANELRQGHARFTERSASPLAAWLDSSWAKISYEKNAGKEGFERIPNALERMELH
jgi:hypothetical protein